MIPVRVAAEYDAAVLDHGPCSLMRKEKYETESADQSESAEVPGDERTVERIVLDREHMSERRLFEIGEFPLVTCLRRTDRSILRHISAKREDADTFASRRRHAKHRGRVVV